MSDSVQTARPIDELVEVLSNEQVAPSICLLGLSAPGIARSVAPGQFVHLQVPDFEGHVLRRPFSVRSWNRGDGTIGILYQVVGAGSRRLADARPGQATRAIGPVGRGWRPPAATRHALLVGGGMGVAPLTMLAAQLVHDGAQVDVLLGALTRERLTGSEMLRGFGAAVHVCTDDGTAGHAGFCTDLIADFGADADYAAVCGPEPMERAAIAQFERLRPGYADDSGFCLEVSLERRMACGIGACLSCVVDTVEGKKRACVDGPVFAAKDVVWP